MVFSGILYIYINNLVLSVCAGNYDIFIKKKVGIDQVPYAITIDQGELSKGNTLHPSPLGALLSCWSVRALSLALA